jgi:hypothetical protein
MAFLPQSRRDMLVFIQYSDLTARIENGLQLGQASPRWQAQLASLPQPRKGLLISIMNISGWVKSLTAGTGVSSATGAVEGSSMAFSGSA